MRLLRWLACARHGHRIDFFSDGPANVVWLGYGCSCGRRWVRRDAALDVLGEVFGDLSA